jgi:hypothetical protein
MAYFIGLTILGKLGCPNKNKNIYNGCYCWPIKFKNFNTAIAYLIVM